MLKLEKNERIEVWEVQAVIATKKQNHPFVSLLMAAVEIKGEGNVVTSTAIRERLFQSLPQRGLENLLRRMCASDLFLELLAGEFDLTDWGYECAQDKSIWIEEQGVYQIGFTNSPLIPQKIIFIKEVPKENLKVEGENILPRPGWLNRYIGSILEFPNATKQILDIEPYCIRKQNLNLKMSIECQPAYGLLEVKHEDCFYRLQIADLNETNARKAILSNDSSLSYDTSLDLVRVAFDSQNLSFNRNHKIGKPKLRGEEFQPITLENVRFIPATTRDAEQWFSSLVVQGINRYFKNDQEFEAYQLEIQAKFHPHYSPMIHPRAAFVKAMSNGKDFFYHRAKLETINYLNY